MRTSTRWAIPVAVTATIAASVLVVPQLASADPELPPTTAAELLVKVATAQTQAFSGTVVLSADLGLPELPTGRGAGTDLTSLIVGNTNLRVWSDGPERLRLAVLGANIESDVVRNGRDLWTWSSVDNSASHVTLPEEPAAGADAQAAPEALASAPTPQEAAERALAAIDPSTEVTLDGTASVADRDAYELVLEPRDADSLIGEVRLAVDSVTSLPLRVQVTARGAAAPAYETAFTDVSFDTPGADVFRFSPPAGAEVSEGMAEEGIAEEEGMAAHEGMGTHEMPADAAPGDAPGVADGSGPTVIGEDWTSVVVLRGVDAGQVGEAAGAEGVSGIAGALLAGFEPWSEGGLSGRILSTSLVTALWLDDGRVLVGAVTPEVLAEAAADPAAALVP